MNRLAQMYAVARLERAVPEFTPRVRQIHRIKQTLEGLLEGLPKPIITAMSGTGRRIRLGGNASVVVPPGGDTPRLVSDLDMPYCVSVGDGNILSADQAAVMIAETGESAEDVARRWEYAIHDIVQVPFEPETFPARTPEEAAMREKLMDLVDEVPEGFADKLRGNVGNGEEGAVVFIYPFHVGPWSNPDGFRFLDLGKMPEEEGPAYYREWTMENVAAGLVSKHKALDEVEQAWEKMVAKVMTTPAREDTDFGLCRR